MPHEIAGNDPILYLIFKHNLSKADQSTGKWVVCTLIIASRINQGIYLIEAWDVNGAAEWTLLRIVAMIVNTPIPNTIKSAYIRQFEKARLWSIVKAPNIILISDSTVNTPLDDDYIRVRDIWI